jgi:hypothetical protein
MGRGEIQIQRGLQARQQLIRFGSVERRQWFWSARELGSAIALNDSRSPEIIIGRTPRLPPAQQRRQQNLFVMFLEQLHAPLIGCFRF